MLKCKAYSKIFRVKGFADMSLKEERQSRELDSNLHLRIRELEAELILLKATRASENSESVPLSAREALLAEAERIAHLGSWILDFKTGKVEWSQELFRILGFDPNKDTASTKTFIQAIHPEDAVEAVKKMEALLHQGKMQNTDLRMFRTDGSLRDIVTNGSIVKDENGKAVRAVGTILDVTEARQRERERKQLEIQLRQAQKMEIVGRVAGGIAHDFNNLLTVISGNTQLLLEKFADPHLNHIQEAAELAAALTHQLLAFSRQAIVKPEPLDINSIINEMVKLLKRLLGEDVHLKLILSNVPIFILADRSQMQQIILNLSVNARDAMPMGGMITFQTQEFRDTQNNPWLKLSVIDTGTGMDQTIMDKAFEPFFTTKEPGKGTGLGLSTIHDIVTAAKGKIQIKSEAGKGAEVTIELPIHPIQNKNAKVNELQIPPPKTKGESILIVEDNVNLRDLVATFLTGANYRVKVTSKQQEAESCWLESKDQIDLLITDILMPGKNGYDLAKDFTQEKPSLKTLFISGYSANQKVLQTGAFLQKPFTRSELLSTVRGLLDAKKES